MVSLPLMQLFVTEFPVNVMNLWFFLSKKKKKKRCVLALYRTVLFHFLQQ